MNTDVSLKKKSVKYCTHKEAVQYSLTITITFKARRFVLDGSPQSLHKSRQSQKMTKNLFSKDTRYPLY